MSETRNIVLTGEVADSFGHHGGKRRSRKLSGRGGGSTSAGTIMQLESTASSAEPPDLKVEGLQSEIAKTAAPVLHGGQKKVVLNPKKKVQKVVFLEGKPIKKLEHAKQKTRKSPRKILFSLKMLDKKLKTAKNIQSHSKEKSLLEIKTILIAAKLIKKESKAPESMIRQMYSDYMTMKHKAL